MPESVQTFASDHNTYSLQRVYLMDTGLVQQPVAGTIDGNQEAAFIALHSPIETLAIIWSSESEGMPPVIPDPRTLIQSEPNLIFLRQTEMACIPVPRVSGNGHYWAASCTFYFGMRKPRSIVGGAAMRTGKTPSDNTMSPQDGEYPRGGEGFNVLDPRQ